MPIFHALRSAPRLFLLYALTGFALPAVAGIYKCQAPGGGTVYQQTPCPGSGAETTIAPRHPGTAEEEAALERGQRDKAAAQELEREQDTRRLEAVEENEKRQAARRETEARCAKYRREANAAARRSQTRKYQHDREDEDRQAEFLRKRYFSECYVAGQ